MFGAFILFVYFVGILKKVIDSRKILCYDNK